jgi:hypothetical protein
VFTGIKNKVILTADIGAMYLNNMEESFEEQVTRILEEMVSSGELQKKAIEGEDHYTLTAGKPSNSNTKGKKHFLRTRTSGRFSTHNLKKPLL